MKMTSSEFNEKYKDHLEEGFEGLLFLNQEVIDYCDKIFQILLITNPDFTYSQIKRKWGTSRVYLDNVDHRICTIMKDEIDRIILKLQGNEI